MHHIFIKCPCVAGVGLGDRAVKKADHTLALIRLTFQLGIIINICQVVIALRGKMAKQEAIE